MTRPARRELPIVLLLCGMVLGGSLLGGCKKAPESPAPATQPAVETLTQKNESGPVQATVTLSPKKPRLGDPLTLTLTVEAKPGVSVEMPPFGEALGRFSIASFTPRSETAADGSSKHSQRYVLEAPMSGRQRIPSLRIEFTDTRPGVPADGGDASHELLTDEIAIDITSVLPEGEDKDKGELRGLREPLEESIGRARLVGYGLLPLAIVGAIAAYFIVRGLKKRARLRVRISAYDAALSRLEKLKQRGWPNEANVDAFYVELSDIVRRYIEDRYGVRAPELTTEEFLREARRELRLEQAQRELLEAFLSTCDRVKFAGYRPGESESQQAFAEAGRFLADTRLQAAGRAEAQP